MERIIIVLLLGFSGLAFAFDMTGFQGGQVDKQQIRDFGNQQKNTYLSDPSKFKDTIGKKLGYDESKLNNLNSVIDENKKQQIIQMMQNFNQSTYKWTYKCSQKRVVKIVSQWMCNLTQNVFNDYDICDANCIKQRNCNQAKCYQTASCQALQGGYICPIGQTQCNATITCASGGTYNANTGKCEANPDDIGYCYIKGHLAGQYIYGLYKIILNRTPDTEGFLWWLSNWNSVNRDNVAEFVFTATYSQHKESICGYTQEELKKPESAKIRDIIADYVYYLGRCPTKSEVEQWYNDENYSLDKLASSETATEECESKLCPSPPFLNGDLEDFTYDKTAGTWISRDLNVCNKYSEFSPVVFVKIVNYTCPIGNYPCIQASSGVAYCSPYACNNTSYGVWCANGNVSGMSANTIGKYQCSYDGSWYVDLQGCQSGCDYYQCEMNNEWYQGQDKCLTTCREKGQCQEVE